MGTLKEIENRYYKECNVVMLPTEDKTAPILKYIAGSLQYFTNTYWSNSDLTKQHLYFTTDDEIKEGEYYIANNTIFKADNKFDKGNNPNIHKYPKIIATTDKSLTNRNYNFKVEEGFKGFNEYLPQPSHSFIKKYCEQGGIDKVLVEYEWNGGRAGDFDYELKTDSHNTITIKSVKDSWTRKEVEAFGKKCFDYGVKCESGQIEFEDYGKELDWIKENLWKHEVLQLLGNAWTAGYESNEDNKLHNIAKVAYINKLNKEL